MESEPAKYLRMPINTIEKNITNALAAQKRALAKGFSGIEVRGWLWLLPNQTAELYVDHQSEKYVPLYVGRTVPDKKFVTVRGRFVGGDGRFPELVAEEVLIKETIYVCPNDD